MARAGVGTALVSAAYMPRTGETAHQAGRESEPAFLLGPGVGQGLRQRRDGEIGRCAAVNERGDDAWSGRGARLIAFPESFGPKFALAFSRVSTDTGAKIVPVRRNVGVSRPRKRRNVRVHTRRVL